VFNKKSLSIFLHRHTTSTAYIKALVNAPHRFDLDGQAAGEIAPEHKAAGAVELERRLASVQAKRLAEREAQRTAHRAARQMPAAAGGAPDAEAPADAAKAALPGAEGQTPTADAPRGPRPDRPPRGDRPPSGDRPPRPDRGAAPAGAPRGDRPPRSDRPPRGDRPAGAERAGRPAGPGGDRPPRPPRPERQGGDHGPPMVPREPAMQAEPPPSAVPLTPEQLAENDARRSRAQLLRAFETTTLTRANFCALKGMKDNALEALLVQARGERGSEPPRDVGPGSNSGPRRPRPVGR
jgi:hypothetical protein